jgi:putative nucleotide binding protein
MKRQVEGSKKGKRYPPRNMRGLGKVLVLDYYPQGKSLSRKSAEAFNPLAVVISINRLQFFDIILSRGKNVQAGQTLDTSTLKPDINRINKIGFNELSDSAVKILPEIIKKIVMISESRFINFLNQARPLTTQMHQLQLLPGIGNKRLWQIIEARRKTPFKNLDDFTERTGISDPIGLFSNRILQEIQGEEKYQLFIKKPK